MTDSEDPSALKDLDARLKDAQARQAAQKADRTTRQRGAAGSGLGFGLRIATELLVALLMGAGVGLLLDRWLGTSPLFLIVLFFMGAAAGFLNVYRVSSGQGYGVGFAAKSDKAPEKQDDGTGKEA